MTTMVRPSLISLLSPIDKPKLTIEEDEVWKFYESYPFFPPRSNSVNDTDEIFVDFMETSIQVMESWICSQGFFGITYYNIPDGISHVRFINDENNKLKPRLPLVEMLINIIGEDAEQYFEVQTNTKFEANELEHAYIVYHIYKKVIEFLISQGALFACVHPAYLLPFNMYTLYIKNMANMVADEKLLTIGDHSMFCRLGKQCWLDVVLQAYKVIVLKRVIQPYQGTSFNDEEALNDPTQKYRHSIKNIVRNSHLFSAPELLLLNWLEFHYNDERQKYWPDNPYLEYRKVSHFCENLEDGYVYAALTLAYCPYLQGHFKKMAPQPVSPEEILHNNALLVQSWEILNLNTGVTVRSMIEAHPLKTLVTIVYLFETLPNLHPKEKLELKAGLSAHITKSLILGNRNDFDVAYKAILYGNNDKCFSIKKDFFVIAPKTKCKIQVTYWAKFVKRSSCTLILSGECSGYRLAKSKVVTLSGEPNVSVVSASYEISTELCKIHDEKLIVRSPYPVPASYRIQHAYENCLSSDDVDQLEYREDYRAFNLPRCISTITELVCNKNGEGELLVCVYPLTMRVIPATLYFRNQEVGDFAIKITTLTTPLLRQEILTVELPYGFGLSQTNDLEVFLEIPCQNHTMWKGIIEMLVKFAVTDVFFWKDVIRTTAGMHALQRLLCLTSEPYSHNIKFYEPCEFKIKPDKKSNVILPNTVYIADRCSSSCVKVPIIFKEKQHEAHDFAIILKSLDGLEIRHYKVCFVKRAESVSDNKNNI